MNKHLLAAAASGLLLLTGAGCASGGAPSVTDSSVPLSPTTIKDGENVDEIIREAEEMDRIQTERDRSAHETEMSTEEKDAIETPEGEGVTF